MISGRSKVKEQLTDELAAMRQRIAELQAQQAMQARAVERIEHLNRLKEDLLSPASLDEKIKRITDGVVEIFDADFARIWITQAGDLCDSGCFHAEVTEGPHVCRQRDHCLRLAASSGRYTYTDGRIYRRVPFGCYEIGWIAAGETPKFITNDAMRDPCVHDHDWAKELGLVAFAGYRLLSESEQPIGVLALFRKHAISPDEDALLQGLANTTAQVIHTARTQENLRERERFLALLNDITRAALETPDLPAMLQILADRLGELFRADGCYITLWDEVKQMTIPAAAYGDWQKSYRSMSVEPGEATMTESVLRAGHPLVAEDVYDTPYLSRRIAELFPDRSLLGLPLIADGRKLGAALIAFNEPHDFTPGEIARGEQAAGLIALAVAKTQGLEIEHEQRIRAETLADVTLALTSQTNYRAVLDEILRQARRIVPHSTANIALLEDDGLHTVYWRGYQDYTPSWEQTVLSLVQSLADWPIDAEVIRSRQAVVIFDTRQEPDWVELEETIWIRSYLAVPICLHDRILGLLRLDSDLPDQFSIEDARRLEPLASAAAIAIENAQLFAEVQQRIDELETLRHTSLQITSLLDLSSVLETIAQGTLSLVGATNCHIYLHDAATGSFTFGAALWQDGSREPAVEMPRRDGFTALVAREGHAVVVNDASQHPLFTTPEAKGWNVRAISGFPLKRAGKIVGVFTVTFLEPHTFDENELRVLELLADQAVIAIENARLVEGLEAVVAARTAEILAEKEKSEAILHSVGEAIAMTDPETQIQYVNVAFSQLTGYAAQEIEGQSVHTLAAKGMSEQDRQSLRLALKEEQPWQGEVTIQRKDGRVYDAALTIAPVRDAEGHVVGYVASHSDISHIKTLERARSQFMTNVSHELRTPVANIKLYAQLLRKGGQSKKTDDYLLILEQQAERLNHLIQDILEIVSLDSGLAMTAWTSISVSTLVRDLVARHQSRAEEAGLTLEIASIPADLPVVEGNQTLLAQALDELIENAVIFTPVGGKVKVETQAAEKEGECWVTLAVHDTGPGIAPEELAQVFDRFFRGRLAEPGHIPGSGLGLSIAKEIMQAHGGQVTVESHLDQGSTFTLWLRSAR